MAAPKKRKQRNYSDKEKASALVILDFCGGNELKAARKLGIPRITLREWAQGRVNTDVSESRHEKKADLAELLEETVVASLEQKKADPSKISGIETAAFIDKLLLLRGEPNTISKDVTHASPERRRERILELVEKAKVA
ncbi:MAG TPA: hypothetical protein VFS27_06225 [Blastocatellia bacterium]|jgi:hypothetical protein|nr:hypothetical protein [Blastocatellia bacterium]